MLVLRILLYLQGVNRLFVLSFKDVDGRESYKQQSSNCGNKGLECYDPREKFLWSANKKRFTNIL